MKRGFTLIELLAVIVILAIIALIAVPIVLNIISDSKKSTLITSGENYVNAVENAITLENIDRKFNPNICTIQSNGNLICDNEDNEIEVEFTGERPISGKLIFDDNKLTTSSIDKKYKTRIDFKDYSIVLNEQNKLDIFDDVLITSIDFSYPNCSKQNSSCIPEITIQPENATNKELIFEMDSICTTSCYADKFDDSSKYLSINNKTGELKKLATPNFVDAGVYRVKVTIYTIDGSDIVVSKNVPFYSTGWHCWV